jgi:hypothetical protein
MIRAILRLVEWLDRRFPAKVCVTVEKFDEIYRLIDIQTKRAMGFGDNNLMLHERITRLEDSVSAIKELLAKPANPAKELLRRADFIASGRMGE